MDFKLCRMIHITVRYDLVSVALYKRCQKVCTFIWNILILSLLTLKISFCPIHEIFAKIMPRITKYNILRKATL